jgi:hypothetical protein
LYRKFKKYYKSIKSVEKSLKTQNFINILMCFLKVCSVGVYMYVYMAYKDVYTFLRILRFNYTL